MSQAQCSMVRRWERLVHLGVLFFMTTFGLAAQLSSQITGPAEHGALEVTSGLGRKLYALPDDQSVIEARKNLAADPKNVERVLQLSDIVIDSMGFNTPRRCSCTADSANTQFSGFFLDQPCDRNTRLSRWFD